MERESNKVRVSAPTPKNEDSENEDYSESEEEQEEQEENESEEEQEDKKVSSSKTNNKKVSSSKSNSKSSSRVGAETRTLFDSRSNLPLVDKDATGVKGLAPERGKENNKKESVKKINKKEPVKKRNKKNDVVKQLTEKTDIDKILKLITSDEITEEQCLQLKNYRRRINNNTIQVKYYFSKGLNFGRIWAEDNTSLQNFKKGIRHTLAADIYEDIDMVNAGPSLIAQYCKKNNIKCPYLLDYNNNREKWLNDIIECHSMNRSQAKKLMNKICYLGNYSINDIIRKSKFIRCCICYELNKKIIDVNNGNVCDICHNKAKNRLNDQDKNYDDIELMLIDIYHEKQKTEVCSNTSLKHLTELLTDIYPFNEDEKLEKINKLSDELKIIASHMYIIEKEITEIVEKDDTRTNKKSSVLSLVTQRLENRCLMAMSDFFNDNNFKIGVYCFDGLMIEKDKKNRITNDILDECCLFVEKCTGYKIKLDIKPMDEGITLPELDNYVEEDKDVQEKLFKLEDPKYFRFSNKELYVFNEKTGKYETNIESLYYYIIKHQNYFLVEIPVGKDNVKVKSYGKTTSLMKQIPPLVKTESKDEEWLERTVGSSVGYLLFKDGIYNMKNNTFTKGFNPDIVFHERIPHIFPERNEDEIKYAADISFNLMFEDPLPLIVAFARALFGRNKDKNFYFCPGPTNAGKSKLVNMFENCFGGYIKNFNAESMANAGKNDTKDEAARYRWMYLIRFARIIFSNEVNMKKDFDGNCIKKLASGGDKAVGRTHNKEETAFKAHFTPFCMLNDIPKIDPLDDAVYERLFYFEFKKQFVKNPTEEHHIKADPDFEETIQDPKFIRGFTHLILDGFQYYLKHGQPEFNRVTKDEWTDGDRKDKNITELLHSEFDFTGKKEDFIAVAEMANFRNKYKKEFMPISNKWFNDIVESTFKIKQERKNTSRGWFGLKKKEIDYVII